MGCGAHTRPAQPDRKNRLSVPPYIHQQKHTQVRSKAVRGKKSMAMHLKAKKFTKHIKDLQKMNKHQKSKFNRKA